MNNGFVNSSFKLIEQVSSKRGSEMNMIASSRPTLVRLVSCIGIFLGALTSPIVNAQTAQNLANGKSLYETYKPTVNTLTCAGCHSTTPTNASDKTYGKVGNGKSATVLRAAIGSTATNAKFPAMQPFWIMTTQQVADMAAYIAFVNGAPIASPSVNPLTFPTSIPVNSSSSASSFTVTNTGNGPLAITTVALTAANTADFTITSNTCANSSLAINAICTVNVVFNPKTAGTRTGGVVISHNSSAAGTTSTTVGLSGTATATTPSIAVTATGTTSPLTTISFPSTAVNTTATQSVTVTNNGAAALSITSFTLAGTNANQFALKNNTCPVSPATLGINATCSFDAVFSPTAAGTNLAATISILSNAGNAATYTLNLSGTATQTALPSISATPASLAFTPTTVNTPASSQTVTLKNNGQAQLTISSIGITGADAADFSQNNTCGPAPIKLVVNATCAVTVGFKPLTVASAKSASLQVASDASNGATFLVALSGSSTPVPVPAITLDTNTMAFGNQLLNTASGNMSVTVTNSGTADLTVTNAVSDNPAFSVVNNCLSAVKPSGFCLIDVSFKPSATGAIAGNLTISGTDPANPTVKLSSTVSLSGTGTAAASGGGANAVNGSALYQANCATCHSANPASKVLRVELGVNAQTTKNAMISFSAMNTPSLKALTTQDLNDIAAYIAAQTNQSPVLISTGGSTGNTGSTGTNNVTNVGSGGCTIGTTDSLFDPLLILMAAISLVVLVRRQTKR